MRNPRRNAHTVMGRVIRRRQERWRPHNGTHPDIVGRARNWARRILPALLIRPARPDLGDDLDLVLSELVTNAITHGGGCAEVELHATEHTLRLSVTDTRAAPPVVRPADEVSRESGRGMLLVQMLARRWGVRRHRRHAGKAVWLELSLNR
jgi:anti-sigma regulatory factor (Ser/Thr protein kinase)